MKLLGALTSPYVRKVRIVMAEKKLDYQLVLEDVWNSDAIQKANPLGKVPCLVMEGGEAVFDSRVIVEYLDTLSPVGAPDPGQRPRACRGAHLGGAGRRRAGRQHRGPPRADLGRPQRHPAQPGLDRAPDGQGQRRDHRDVARVWATSRLPPASTSRWPTSRSAVRSAISISASRRSTGARRTRTWRAWPTSWRNGRASSTRCRPSDGQAASSDSEPLRRSQLSLR